MASDRSRFTYDEDQRYSAVIVQQGKPLMDADLDEAQQILSEEMRREALDFVGPSGTPDDGYKITIPSPTSGSDFQIGPGTMYVGGIRVSLPEAITYNSQPDWLTPAPATGLPARNEVVYLEVTEHEVSALEDRSLFDPALGGLETARRMRVMQRIRRAETTATNCADALTAQIAVWNAAGRTFDPLTRSLASRATLKVTFTDADTAATACDPPSAGSGYLGAENQLIRICLHTPKWLVWAYDNASALYRVDTAPAAGSQQLVLSNAPLDAMRQPRPGQFAEIARAAGRLPNGEYFSESIGKIVKIAGYDADTRTLSLDDVAVSGPAPQGPLFVRIWEESLEYIPGTPRTLKDTGIQVTLREPVGSVFVSGDFWTFAVRPGQPGQVFPSRYGTDQPPEGPRTWACGLAVLEWASATQGNVREDCREKFDNLVELTNRRAVETRTCCTATITKDDLVNGSLQPIVDRAKTSASFKLCLLPGDYVLSAPVVIGKEHGDLTIEACGTGVTISAAAGTAFAEQGVFQLVDNPSGVTIRGIRFATRIERRATENAGLGITLRLINAAITRIERCQFTFEVPELQASLGVAILANGLTNGLVVRDNIFVGATNKSGSVAVVGLAAVPGFFARSVPRRFDNTIDLSAIEYLPGLTPQELVSIRDKFQIGGFVTEAANAGPFLNPLPIFKVAVADAPAAADSSTNVNEVSERPATSGIDATQLRPGAGLFNPIEVSPITTPGVVIDYETISDYRFFDRDEVSTGAMLPARLPAAEISGNQFALMHAAVLLCADLGAIRCSRNRVEWSENGVIAVTTRWAPSIAFLNQSRIVKAFGTLETANAAAETSESWNAVQASAELLATMFVPRNAHVASALMSVALPAALEKDPTLLPMVGDVDDSKWPAPIADAAHWLFPKTSAITLSGVDGVRNLTGSISRRVQDAWGKSSPFSMLVNKVVAGLGLKPVESIKRSTTFAFECYDNTIEARIRDGGETGIALLVLDAPGDPGTAAIVGANRLSNESRSVPAAVIAFVSRCDVTGSLVINESTLAGSKTDGIPMHWSLLLFPPATILETQIDLPNEDGVNNPNVAALSGIGTAVITRKTLAAPLAAATGNVFKGWPLLPVRVLPASVPDPLNKWVYLNTVTW